VRFSGEQGVEDTDPIPLSALQHWSYCPRQCALIHVEQAFEDNVHTLRGRAVHLHVDSPGYEVRAGMRLVRALPVWHDRLGLIGRADLVEFGPDGVPYPVEFKHGRRRVREHDDLQVAAQAMCLEEMLGRSVAEGAIYHASSRRRRIVTIDSALRSRVETAVREVRTLLKAGRLPPPANDARCRECSLFEVCQPQPVANRQRQAELLATLYDPAP
jgi:CRISPR-associated exonuclease Cas4